MQSGTTSLSWPPATTPSSPTEASPPGTAVVVAIAAVSVAYIHLLSRFDGRWMSLLIHLVNYLCDTSINALRDIFHKQNRL